MEIIGKIINMGNYMGVEKEWGVTLGIMPRVENRGELVVAYAGQFFLGIQN